MGGTVCKGTWGGRYVRARGGMWSVTCGHLTWTIIGDLPDYRNILFVFCFLNGAGAGEELVLCEGDTRPAILI